MPYANSIRYRGLDSTFATNLVERMLPLQFTVQHRREHARIRHLSSLIVSMTRINETIKQTKLRLKLEIVCPE